MGIKVLDCTLRDGAYVNYGKFGDDCIKGVIQNLADAGVEIIECGWLRNCEPVKNFVFYSIPDDLKKLVSEKKTELSLMFDYGKYDVSQLPHNNGLVDILRIAFYKKNLDEMSFVAQEVKSKGYKVFLQASNFKDYSEKEVVTLCKRANYIGADSVYIVDSFGSMYPEDLANVLPIFAETVDKNIEIGFHCHNNIQLAQGLSIQFINSLTNRDIIVDSTLCGIGRGAGNTKTELLLEYLNSREKKYDTELVWNFIEKYISPLYRNHNWEYTPQKGLLGINNLHP